MLFLYFFILFIILSYSIFLNSMYKLLVSTTLILNNHYNPYYYQKLPCPPVINMSDRVIMYKSYTYETLI